MTYAITYKMAQQAGRSIEKGRGTIASFVSERLKADTAESREEILTLARWYHSEGMRAAQSALNTACRRATDRKVGISCKSEKDAKGNSRSLASFVHGEPPKREGGKVPKKNGDRAMFDPEQIREWLTQANDKQVMALIEELENLLLDAEEMAERLGVDVDSSDTDEVEEVEPIQLPDAA